MRFFRSVLAAAAVLAASAPAHAALGGRGASVEADRARMSASPREVKSRVAGWSVQQIVTPEGTSIREYVSAGDRVFAVAWDGPALPDLQQLLGDHFAPFRDAALAKRGVRRPFVVQTPDAVVVSDGHPRAFSGRAWIPSLLPDGFAAGDVK